MKLNCFLNKVLDKDEVWVLKLVLFQIGVLIICGLVYVGRLLS